MSSRVRSLAPYLSWAVLFLFFVACSGSESRDPGPAAPEIVAFLAEPDAIEAGQATTLRWQTTNAVGVTLADAAGASLGAAPLATSGELAVTPAVTTTYVLEATAAGGKSVRRELAVQVLPIPPAPTIEAFTIDPPKAARGSAATLAWQVTGADEIRIVDSVGRTVHGGDAAEAQGSLQVRVDRDSAWTLTAKSRGGEVSARATASMVPAPRASLVASATPVVPGTSAALGWNAQNADRVVITDAAGTVLVDTTTELSGSRTVHPNVTTRYTLRATGIGGEVVTSTELLVRPVIERFAIETAGPVRSGDAVTVSWAIRGATAATLANSAGTRTALAGAQLQAGTATLPVGPDGALSLQVSGGSLQELATARVDISLAPRVNTFAPHAPEVSARPDLPAIVRLTYLVDGASTMQLIAEPGGVVDVGFASLRSGVFEVPITEPTTFRLVAANNYGVHEAATQVGIVPAPRIDAFRALPLRVGVGEGVPLSWSVADATSIRIERDGVDIGVPPAMTTGTVEDPLFSDATYVLRSFNRLGFEIASEPVDVTVGDPIIATFDVDRPVIPAGQLLTFSWNNVGGRNLELRDNDGALVFSTTSPDEIARGSAQVVAPLLDATHNYTLRVINGVAGASVGTLPVVVVGGPLVRTFHASTAGITLGGNVSFDWLVDNDAQNRTPALTLTDDLGNVYDLGGANPNAGSATIRPVEAGATTFTLHASTPGTTASSANVPVVVYGVPVIETAVAAPAIVDTNGGTVPAASTLSWTTRHGAQIDVFKLNAAGNPVTPALFSSVAPTAVAAGSVPVTPVPGENDYLVVVRNGAGAAAEAVVTVRVDPAQITSLTANPADILFGESSTLTWVTSRATQVQLQPALPSVAVGTNAFVDISTRPTAQLVPTTSEDVGHAIINFPAGFTFPWYGSPKTALRAMTKGFISFNMSATAIITNTLLPSTTNPNVHLAPYWDDTHVRGTGQIWWDTGTDAQGTYLVVMWKNYQYFTSTDNPASLNFEVFLRPSGAVEYRYGSMTSARQVRADASEATIGLQNENATQGYTLSFNTAIPGGLSNRSVSFAFTQPLSGSWNVTPAANTTYTLTATNAHSTDTAQVTVRVHQPATARATVTPAEPQVGVPFTIAWNNTNATDVRVLDAQGGVRCVASSTALLVGSCSITEITAGPRTYTLRVVGRIARDVVNVPINTHVFGPFTLTAASRSLAVGGSTTLSWVTTDATAVTLTANGQPVDLTGRSFAADTIAIAPTATTEYLMTMTDSTNRVRRAVERVEVRTANVGAFTASSNQVPSGTSVTLNWASTGGSGAYVSGLLPAAPISDVSTSVSFTDISTSPTATLLTLSSATGFADYAFPSGFRFPYFGDLLARIRVFAYGYVSFNPAAAADSGNGTLPFPSNTTSTMVHLAPFWDSLSAQATGRVYVDQDSDAQGRYVVVQWSHFQFSSSTFNPADLNFQVLLRDNGVFEYRYGAMTGPTAQQQQADGKSATIGFQNLYAELGTTWLNNPTTTPAPLSNKALRIDLRMPASGQATVAPTESRTYTVCNPNLGYMACSEQTVVVVKPGDVMISELMIAPTGPGRDPGGEWIELRNTTPFAIDLSGFTLTSGAESAVISPGVPLVVEPGGFLVLSGVGGPPQTAWSYGAALTLANVQDDVALGLGTLQIDRVAWDASWSAPAGQSLRLDSRGFNRKPTANDARSAWCTSTSVEVYDGTNAGTPGTLGLGCLSTTYDIDPASSAPFIDITADDNQIVWNAPGSTSSVYGQVPGGIGFAFPFFGTTFPAGTPVGVSSSGLLSFSVLTSSYTSNVSMPSTSAPNAVIAPFWDTLYIQTFTTTHAQQLNIGGQNVLVVQWNNARFSPNGGRVTFQAQLWENGDVVMAYREIEGATVYRGTNATIGMEDGTGATAVQYSFNTEAIWPDQTIYFRKH